MTALIVLSLALSPPPAEWPVQPDFADPLLEHRADEGELVRFSHYWPAWLGTNCGRVEDGRCVSRTASGERWQDWVRRGVACSTRYEFGTVFVFRGREWTCVDRGPAVVGNWVDFMTPIAYHPHGTLVRVEIVPGGPRPVEKKEVPSCGSGFEKRQRIR